VCHARDPALVADDTQMMLAVGEALVGPRPRGVSGLV
jgi:hypothetical protein